MQQKMENKKNENEEGKRPRKHKNNTNVLVKTVNAHDINSAIKQDLD